MKIISERLTRFWDGRTKFDPAAYRARKTGCERLPNTCSFIERLYAEKKNYIRSQICLLFQSQLSASIITARMKTSLGESCGNVSISPRLSPTDKTGGLFIPQESVV